MQGNVLGQTRSSTGLNIFTQPLEPSKKDGIWIKTDEKINYNEVQIVNNIEPLISSYTKLANIPWYFKKGSAVAIGTDIYLLGVNEGDGRYIYNYKYDTVTNKYTKLKDIPYELYDGSAVSIETDIYLLGGSNSTKYNYKYDTLTNSYTKLEEIPYEFYNGSAVSIETDIYLLGTSYDNCEDYNYKYETERDIVDKTVFIETMDEGNKILLNKLLNIYFVDAKMFNNNAWQEYPVYYGNGSQWVEIN